MDVRLALIRAVAHQPTGLAILAPAEHRRQALVHRELRYLRAIAHRNAFREDDHRVTPGDPDAGQRGVELAGPGEEHRRHRDPERRGGGGGGLTFRRLAWMIQVGERDEVP